MSVITMPADLNQRAIAAADRYGQRFGMLPPMFYIGHLSDDDFIALIEAALRAGKPISVDDWDNVTDENILL